MWFEQNLKEAIESPRVHHHLEPMVAEYEEGLEQVMLALLSSHTKILKFFLSIRITKALSAGLQALGHTTQPTNVEGADVNAIHRNGTTIYANADFRKKADAAGF